MNLIQEGKYLCFFFLFYERENIFIVTNYLQLMQQAHELYLCYGGCIFISEISIIFPYGMDLSNIPKELV